MTRFGRGGRFVSFRPEHDYVLLPGGRNCVIYNGPSRLTGDGILVIAGWHTSNRKLGPMLQLWILLRDMDPIDAVRGGHDVAICGDCEHRGLGDGRQRSCYVGWWREAENIWQAWKHGNSDTSTPRELAGRVRGKAVRYAAYGDPVAVPLEVWDPLLEVASTWTAYTQQWDLPIAEAYQHFCMASVNTPGEQVRASMMGWRTYRTRPTDRTPLLPGEIICPYELGRAKCASCRLCRGNAVQAKNIVAVVHGKNQVKWFRNRAEAARSHHA